MKKVFSACPFILLIKGCAERGTAMLSIHRVTVQNNGQSLQKQTYSELGEEVRISAGEQRK